MLTKTNSALDFRFWRKNYFEEDHYSICIFYLLTFHILYFLLLFSLIKASLKSPGYLDEKFVK